MSEPAPPNPSNKPPCSREDALAVLLRLRRAGHVAYFAGGCVRDLLLGREPKDYDVATDAPPARVRGLFSNTQAVGAAFGVILVKHGRSTVEVATFRTDGAYTDGRRPDAVTFTDARTDAGRRDFTINGLFLDPETNPPPPAAADGPTLHPLPPHGVVIDYVGGVTDLRDRLLRAIGDPARRFAEDHLRLLRAVRFAARFGLTVEDGTAAAIRANAPKLKGISPERVADELRVMLTPAQTRERAWRMLWEYGLAPVVFRFLPAAAGAGEVALEEGRSLFRRVARGEPISFALTLAAGVLDWRMAGGFELTAAVTRAEVQRAGRAMREALKISNEELDEMVGVLEPLAALLGDGELSVAARKRFMARATAAQTRALLRAVAELGMSAERVAWLEREFAALEGTEVAPPPVLTGDDLVAARYAPGPAFKRILEAVYDAQLEGRVTDTAAALGMARELLKREGEKRKG
jgi:poly(A) polymerase